MGLAQIGVPSLILILVVALLIFGPSKLPEIGKALGQSLKEFKHSTGSLLSEDKDEGSPEKESR